MITIQVTVPHEVADHYRVAADEQCLPVSAIVRGVLLDNFRRKNEPNRMVPDGVMQTR